MAYDEKYNKAWRKKNPERVRGYKHKYNTGNRDKLNEYMKKWTRENPEKRSAERKLQKAVWAGKIERPGVCSGCGNLAKVHGHHHDYTRPLEVIWLCRVCHRAIHNRLEVGNLA